MKLRPGTALGPYLIEDEIGRGGFATVYRAHDPRFGGPVAIKVLASHLSADAEAVERFLGEARALRSVDGESIVAVFDIAVTDNDQPYMVLQYADRGTLEDRLSRGIPATDGELRRVARFLTESLGILHDRAMVHRDVKPSNVLITEQPGSADVDGGLLLADERLVLGDLGLVKDLSSSPAVTRGSGSAAYAAPEQRAVVSRVDTRSDVYAATAVLAELAVGRVRRADESWEQLLEEVAEQRGVGLSTSLARGLSESPEDRPPDVVDLLAGVEHALDGRPGTHLGAVGDNRQGLSTRVRLAVGALALVLVAGTAFMLTDRTERLNADGVRAETAADTEQPPAEETEQVLGEQVTAATEACGDPTRGVAEGRAPADVRISDVTDTTITVEWAPEDRPFSIFLDGRYFDNARKNSSQYVFEGLDPATLHDVVIIVHDGDPSGDGALVCATTSADPVDRVPEGLTMATDLVASSLTPTSATLSWTAASSGGRYTLYSGNLPEGKNFPTIVGAGGVPPDQTSFLFEDLERGARVVLGLRTVLGENQSGLAWIEVQLPGE